MKTNYLFKIFLEDSTRDTVTAQKTWKRPLVNRSCDSHFFLLEWPGICLYSREKKHKSRIVQRPHEILLIFGVYKEQKTKAHAEKRAKQLLFLNLGLLTIDKLV